MRYIEGEWMCSYTFSLLFKKMSWPLEKEKSRQHKNNEQHKQGAQDRAAGTPHSTFYSSQESPSLHIFQYLPSDTVYTQRCG